MKSFFRKTLALMAAMALTVPFASCGKSDESSSKSNQPNMVGSPEGDIDFEDMPEGSSTIMMTQKGHNVPINIEFVRSYLTDDEARLVSEFIDSINNKNGDNMSGCYYKPYLDKYIKDKNYGDYNKYAEAYYNATKEFVGEDFNLNYIVAVNVESQPDFSGYDSRIAEADPDAETTSKKIVNFEIYGSTESMPNMSLCNKMNGEYYGVCIYTINSKPYIM